MTQRKTKLNSLLMLAFVVVMVAALSLAAVVSTSQANAGVMPDVLDYRDGVNSAVDITELLTDFPDEATFTDFGTWARQRGYTFAGVSAYVDGIDENGDLAITETRIPGTNEYYVVYQNSNGYIVTTESLDFTVATEDVDRAATQGYYWNNTAKTLYLYGATIDALGVEGDSMISLPAGSKIVLGEFQFDKVAENDEANFSTYYVFDAEKGECALADDGEAVYDSEATYYVPAAVTRGAVSSVVMKDYTYEEFQVAEEFDPVVASAAEYYVRQDNDGFAAVPVTSDTFDDYDELYTYQHNVVAEYDSDITTYWQIISYIGVGANKRPVYFPCFEGEVTESNFAAKQMASLDGQLYAGVRVLATEYREGDYYEARLAAGYHKAATQPTSANFDLDTYYIRVKNEDVAAFANHEQNVFNAVKFAGDGAIEGATDDAGLAIDVELAVDNVAYTQPTATAYAVNAQADVIVDNATVEVNFARAVVKDSFGYKEAAVSADTIYVLGSALNVTFGSGVEDDIVANMKASAGLENITLSAKDSIVIECSAIDVKAGSINVAGTGSSYTFRAISAKQTVAAYESDISVEVGSVAAGVYFGSGIRTTGSDIVLAGCDVDVVFADGMNVGGIQARGTLSILPGDFYTEEYKVNNKYTACSTVATARTIDITVTERTNMPELIYAKDIVIKSGNTVSVNGAVVATNELDLLGGKLSAKKIYAQEAYVDGGKGYEYTCDLAEIVTVNDEDATLLGDYTLAEEYVATATYYAAVSGEFVETPVADETAFGEGAFYTKNTRYEAATAFDAMASYYTLEEDVYTPATVEDATAFAGGTYYILNTEDKTFTLTPAVKTFLQGTGNDAKVTKNFIGYANMLADQLTYFKAVYADEAGVDTIYTLAGNKDLKFGKQFYEAYRIRRDEINMDYVEDDVWSNYDELVFPELKNIVEKVILADESFKPYFTSVAAEKVYFSLYDGVKVVFDLYKAIEDDIATDKKQAALYSYANYMTESMIYDNVAGEEPEYNVYGLDRTKALMAQLNAILDRIAAAKAAIDEIQVYNKDGGEGAGAMVDAKSVYLDMANCVEINDWTDENAEVVMASKDSIVAAKEALDAIYDCDFFTALIESERNFINGYEDCKYMADYYTAFKGAYDVLYADEFTSGARKSLNEEIISVSTNNIQGGATTQNVNAVKDLIAHYEAIFQGGSLYYYDLNNNPDEDALKEYVADPTAKRDDIKNYTDYNAIEQEETYRNILTAVRSWDLKGLRDEIEKVVRMDENDEFFRYALENVQELYNAKEAADKLTLDNGLFDITYHIDGTTINGTYHPSECLELLAGRSSKYLQDVAATDTKIKAIDDLIEKTQDGDFKLTAECYNLFLDAYVSYYGGKDSTGATQAGLDAVHKRWVSNYSKLDSAFKKYLALLKQLEDFLDTVETAGNADSVNLTAAFAGQYEFSKYATYSQLQTTLADFVLLIESATKGTFTIADEAFNALPQSTQDMLAGTGVTLEAGYINGYAYTKVASGTIYDNAVAYYTKDGDVYTLTKGKISAADWASKTYYTYSTDLYEAEDIADIDSLYEDYTDMEAALYAAKGKVDAALVLMRKIDDVRPSYKDGDAASNADYDTFKSAVNSAVTAYEDLTVSTKSDYIAGAKDIIDSLEVVYTQAATGTFDKFETYYSVADSVYTQVTGTAAKVDAGELYTKDSLTLNMYNAKTYLYNDVLATLFVLNELTDTDSTADYIGNINGVIIGQDVKTKLEAMEGALNALITSLKAKLDTTKDAALIANLAKTGDEEMTLKAKFDALASLDPNYSAKDGDLAMALILVKEYATKVNFVYSARTEFDRKIAQADEWIDLVKDIAQDGSLSDANATLLAGLLPQNGVGYTAPTSTLTLVYVDLDQCADLIALYDTFTTDVKKYIKNDSSKTDIKAANDELAGNNLVNGDSKDYKSILDDVKQRGEDVADAIKQGMIDLTNKNGTLDETDWDFATYLYERYNFGHISESQQERIGTVYDTFIEGVYEKLKFSDNYRKAANELEDNVFKTTYTKATGEEYKTADVVYYAVSGKLPVVTYVECATQPADATEFAAGVFYKESANGGYVRALVFDEEETYYEKVVIVNYEPVAKIAVADAFATRYSLYGTFTTSLDDYYKYAIEQFGTLYVKTVDTETIEGAAVLKNKGMITTEAKVEAYTLDTFYRAMDGLEYGDMIDAEWNKQVRNVLAIRAELTEYAIEDIIAKLDQLAESIDDAASEANISAMQESLSDLVDAFDSLSDSLDALTDRVDTIEGDYTTADALADAIDNAIDALVNGDIADIKGDIQDLKDALDGILDSVQTLEGDTVGALIQTAINKLKDNEIAEAADAIDELNDNFNLLKARVDALEAAGYITTEDAQAALDAATLALRNGDLATAIAKVSDLSGRVKALEDRCDAMESRIESLGALSIAFGVIAIVLIIGACGACIFFLAKKKRK